MMAVELWYAPLAAWLLLVSAWAKRVTILWAVLTPVAVTVVERVALGTHYVQDVIDYRLQDPTCCGSLPVHAARNSPSVRRAFATECR